MVTESTTEKNNQDVDENGTKENYETYSLYINTLVSNLSIPKNRYSALEKLQNELPEQHHHNKQQKIPGENVESPKKEKGKPILHTEPRNCIKFGSPTKAVSTTDNPLQPKHNTKSSSAAEEQCLHLPPFKWNIFKRGYTLGIWLNVKEIHGNCTFYQFRQSKYGGIGICCTINPCSSSNNAEDDYYQVTIYTLPFSHKRGQYIRSKITFLKNTWQFWCISHDNPYNHYIHRPKMQFSISGVLQFTAELVYPTATNNNVSAQQENSEDIIMEENILLGGSNFEGSVSQVLLWKEAFSSAPDFLSGYIGEMGPNVTYQVIIPSIPINRDAMYHDYAPKKRRSEMGIGIPSVLHNNHTMMLSKSEGKLHFRFIPKYVKNGIIILEDVALEGELKNCPKLGVIQPLLQKRSNDSDINNVAFVHQDSEDRNIELFSSDYNFSHTFYCIGGLHSTLLPLFEALIKPPGAIYNLQPKMLRLHLERKNTFDYNFYLDKVLSFLASCLQSSIHLREEAVQTGFCAHLAYLISQSLLDETIDHSRMPKQFSESLGTGLMALFDACCGGSIIASSTSSISDSSATINGNTTRTWETPSSSSIYIRRSSDLALQFLHTFIFPLSMYKYYPDILYKVLSSFVDKYKYMGEFIMKHVSIQYILDQMKFCTSGISRVKSNIGGKKNNSSSVEEESILQFFHFLMLSSLRYSEFCERDVTTTIINLTVCPLGSVSSYVSFHTFAMIVESGDVDVMVKLGRILILCEFHSIIAPVLLSRAVCLNEKDERDSVPFEVNFKNEFDSSYDWKNNWRTAFLLFVWLASVSSVEGEIASQQFGNLLYKSAISGTLYDCMHKEDFIDVLLPSNTNTIDRIKSLLPLLPAIFILLKQDWELGWLCQLLSKMCYFFQRFRTHLSTIKISKEYIPMFVLLFCIIQYYNGNVNVSSSAANESALIKETCLESILDLLSNLILTCMRNGKDCSYEVWANINISLTFILREILISENQDKQLNDDSIKEKLLLKKEKRLVLSKICNVVLRAISSIERAHIAANTSGDRKNANMHKDPHMSWNIDLTQGVSRFVIFIEENELHLEYPEFIPGLIKLLSIGREDLGWMQETPQQQQQDNSSRHLDSSNSEQSSHASEDKLNSQRELLGGGLRRQRSNSILKKEKSIRMSNSSLITPTQMVFEGSNSSKYLLPILRPCLKMVFDSIEQMNVESIHQNILMTEIKLTLSAALMGLHFPRARDTGLEALSSMRKALLSLDEEVKSSYEKLILFTTNELHVRYKTERMIKASADTSISMKDEEVFENMVLGSDFPKQRIGNKSIDDDDFITTLHPVGSASSCNSGASKQLNPATKLGWNQYSGLGSALDSACSSNLEDIEKDDNDCNDNKSDNQLLTLATNESLEMLESYLNKWDEHMLQEKEECSNVPLYSLDDALVGTENFGGYVSSIFQKSNNQSLSTQTGVSVTPTAMSSNNGDSIGEIIEHYIEIVSLERNRIENVKSNVIQTVQKETAKVVENSFWKIYRENCLPGKDAEEWERSALQDGGRDAFSRFVTMPCNPEFEQYLPEHLNPGNLPHQTQLRSMEGEFHLSCDLIGKIKIKDITKEKSRPFEDSIIFDDEHDYDDDDDDGTMLGFPQALSSSSSSSGEEEDVAKISKSMVTEEETLSTGSDTNTTNNAMERNIISENIAHLDYHAQPYPISSFSLPPDIPSVSSQTTTSAHSIFSTNIDSYFDNCLHVRPEGSRKGVLFLTSSYILLEYDGNVYEGDSTVTCEGVNFCKWSIAELSHVYLRRYRLRDSALELFFLPSGGSSSYASSSSAFFDFGPGIVGNKKRDDAANAILKRAPHQCAKQWPKESPQFLGESLNKITLHWCCGNLSNFDYLMEINILAGRSFNDLCQYPIFPFVLCNYDTEEIPDLSDKNNFRDLTKPMGALNEERLNDFVERFETFSDPTIPPFMYGSHYSTSAGVVLHMLLRLHPFANLHRQLQGGHFDVADRLFSHIQRTYEMCTGTSAAEVKELTPEWYCNPSFLRNVNEFFLGRSQEGELLGDVVLPPWAKGSPEKFVEVMRMALESKVCTAMLPSWIDLIFGFKQQGPESIKAHNVFFYLTYYGTIDVASIEDEGLRSATELQIAHFGQCPMQLFFFPHIHKLPSTSPRFKFSLNHVWESNKTYFEEAKLCDWVHLSSPPPVGRNLIAVRICGTDKVVAVDENGIIHFFKWMWKPDEVADDDDDQKVSEPDQGCFVAQRELLHYKTVPRLAYVRPDALNGAESPLAVAISRTMFASQTLLLVLSDGDGKGALALQFLDPSKNIIKGVAIIPSVHSSRITCIAMDTMGSVSYQSYFSGGGGVGGELAILGSEDGSATLWRFISSHYLPLRPRLRLRGHHGSAVLSVSISASYNICATISKNRCCLFHLGNGQLLRSFPPIPGCVFGNMSCFSENGYIILLCLLQNNVCVLTMFSFEGILVGTKELTHAPRKITAVQKNVISVCSSDGIFFMLVSSLNPLQEIENWYFSKGAFDIDIGPYPKQVLAAMASSSGSIVIHALPGITLFSEENRKIAVGTAVGHALAKPAQKIKSAVGNVMNRGTKFVKGVEENNRNAKIGGTSGNGGFGGFFHNAFRKPQT